ncbi:MAG: RidA family protein [Gammaproteobacteria bacterium]|nr:RidA family protein [Gammaproteobacteria bacterium]
MKNTILKPASLNFCFLFVLLSLTTFSSHSADVQYLNSPTYKQLGMPFSEAVRAGNTLYLSGHVGNYYGKLELVPGGIGPETRQTMKNIKTSLNHHGATLNDIVKCTIFLADIKEWSQMNEVYKTFFKEHYPARSAVGQNELAIGARVEIECIAVVSG